MYTTLKSAKIAIFAWSIVGVCMAIVMSFIGFKMSEPGNLTPLSYLLLCCSVITILNISFGVLGALLHSVGLTVYSASILLIITLMEVVCTALLWVSNLVKNKYGPNKKFFEDHCQGKLRTFVCDFVPVVSAINIIMIAVQIILIFNSCILVKRVLNITD